MAADKGNETAVSNQLEIKSHRLSAWLNQFAETEARIIQHANPLVRGISDWLSGARPFYDNYTQAIKQGQNYLALGTQALQKGDANQAGRFLEKAEQFLGRAEFSFKKYLRATQSGAESVVNTLTPIRNSAATFALTGSAVLTFGATTPFAAALAISAGVHTGFLSLSYSPRTDDAIPTFAFELPPRETFPEPNKKTPTTKKSDPSAKAQEDPEFLEKILLAIDESEPDIQGLKRKFQIASQATQKSRLFPLEIKPALIKPASIPLSAPNLPSEAELIEQAKQALREWQRDPKVAHPLGRFLLATELSEAKAYQEVLTKWQENISDYRVAIDPNPKAWQGNIHRMMVALFHDGLGTYTRGHARLTDFLKGEGGNCEAQTKWVLATFAETGLKLPESYQSTIQVFSDHVQPVIYDQKKGRVWNLIQNKWNSKTEAPLYEAHLFYYSYLKAKGVDSPIKKNDLLLSKTGWLSKLKSIPLAILDAIFSLGSRTNTNLRFPEEAELFGLGRVPERAWLPNPYPYSLAERAISLRVWDERGEIGRGYSAEKSEIGLRGFSLTLGHRVLVLETEAQATFYNQLPTIVEKRDFLIDLALQKFKPTLQSPSFEKVLTLLSRPSTIKQYRLEEIGEVTRTLKSVQRFLKFLATYIDLAFRQREGFGSKTTFKDIVSSHPLLNFFIEKKKGFGERMSKNALSFVLFVDQLDKEKRGYFIDWLEEAGLKFIGYLADDPDVTRRAIAKVIADKDLIDIAEEFEKPKTESFEVDIIVVDDEEMPLPIKTNQEKKRPHLISSETMLTYILRYYKEEGVSARWTPVLSLKFFERYLVKGSDYYDSFLKSYRVLFNHYPKNETWVKNPLEAWDEFQISQMTPEARRLWRKEMAQYPEEGKTSGQALIPPDFEPILYRILQKDLSMRLPEEVALFFQTHPDIARRLK